MNDINAREIALDLSSNYDSGEIKNLNLINEAKRWQVPLDIMKEAVKMSLTFLEEDYW